MPSTITVNTTEDGNLRDGVLTLREAILVSDGTLAVSDLSAAEQTQVDAGTSQDRNTIAFHITAASDTGGGYNAATGVATIAPLSALPQITSAVLIDGYTQVGASANTMTIGSNAVLKIQLSGNQTTVQSALVFMCNNSTLRGLVINQFGNVGIALFGLGNVVEGNYIGTDITGTRATGGHNVYGVYGVFIGPGATNNTIGGTTAAARNVISGMNTSNDSAAIFIGPRNASDNIPSNNIVEGNYIGTDATGRYALSNYNGVVIAGGANNVIGGTEPIARNVISGNINTGVVLQYGSVPGGNFVGARGNLVAGNYIGTDATGTTTAGTDGQPLGNANVGVGVYNPGTSGNVIGSTAPGAGNLISGNGWSGEQAVGVLLGFSSSGNSVQGNSIVANVGSGVACDSNAFNNTVGGLATGAGNSIARNGGDGVYVGNSANYGPSDNPHPDRVAFGSAILGNSIHDNAGPGIHLASGTNDNQAAPALTAAYTNSSVTVVTGTLTSAASATYLEFFANAAGDPEGRTLLGSWSVNAGNSTFAAVLPVALPAGQYLVTATATSASNDTSQFSAGVTALGPASVCGVLFKDFNEDGFPDFGESGAPGVSVQLTGTDITGAAVASSATTGANGYYQVSDLLPGTYSVSIPGSLTVTKVTVGLNGAAPAVVGTGHSADGLAIAGGTVQNVVNFGLEPAAGDALRRGQTAGIGFWNNRNGQALVRSLNGGAGHQLGDWLATTFTNMFGSAGASLAGQTNAQVGSYFQLLFATRGDNLEAQVMATALSVYVTNSTLAGGTYATAYGFSVAAGGGAGIATFNVGTDGGAVGQANGTTMTIMDILLAADRHATHAATAAGFALYSGDQAARRLADDLFGRINDTGGI